MELDKDLVMKAKACKTTEELSELAEAEGFELTDEMLDAVSGGVTDEVCIELDSCPSYCQIFNYYGRGRDGDALRLHLGKSSQRPGSSPKMHGGHRGLARALDHVLRAELGGTVGRPAQ